MSTIVLVHGLWMTPRSWEHWIAHYEAAGHRVLAPAYPGLEAEVEALRADPSAIEALTVPGTVAHLGRVVGALERPPILIGHSFGGVLVQILLGDGFGAAGVALHAMPAEGAADPRRIVPLTLEQFRYAFANTLSAGESARAFERYAVPAPGDWTWREPFAGGDRAPLLFIAGGEDNLVPPPAGRAAARRSNADYQEFPGRSHFTVGQDGWEEVADYALEWALSRTACRA